MKAMRDLDSAAIPPRRRSCGIRRVE